jgi:type II secretory pathway component PulJ
MGFSTLIDILGSTIIGSLLLLILFRINDAAVENTYTFSGELQVQEGLVEAVTIIEHDFRKMGYCETWENMPDPTNSIIYADVDRISFLTDVPVSIGGTGDGVIDTLHYYVGPTSELSNTANPNDRLLYRVVNSEIPKGANIGITLFKLTYFDSFGKVLPTPIFGVATGAIHSLQIDVEVESISGYNQKYPSVFWRQIRLAARNLRNR